MRMPFPTPGSRASRGNPLGFRWLRWIGLLLWLTACHSPDSASQRSLAHRFLDEEPQEVLDFASLQKRSKVFSSEFEALETIQERTVQGWRFVDEVVPHTQGISPGEGQRRLRLIRKFPEATTAIERIKVTFLQNEGSMLVLEWAGVGEDFSSERQAEIRTQVPRRDKPQSVFFELKSSKEPIDRLRLSVRAKRGGKFSLVRIVAFTEEISDEGLQRALSRPWKVDLSDDIRNAWLTVPGFHIERALTVPKKASLKFSHALYESQDLPMTFRVTATSDGEPQTLYETTLDPGESSTQSKWRASEVDLSAFAEQEVALRFETLTSQPIEGFEGFAAWANPEILVAQEGVRKPNVILISVDTLRADRMSTYGYERATTPHLDAWVASSAAVFEYAIAQAPWTLPSHTSMLSGLNAFRHGVNHSSPAPQSLDLLAEQLRPAGYSTLAISGGGFVHPDYGLGQGFDRFHYWPRSVGDRKEEFEVGLSTALSWLEESADHPFFLFFHTYEVHQRTEPRPVFYEKFSEIEPDERFRIRNPTPSAEGGFQRSRTYVLETKDESGKIQDIPLPPELAAFPGDIYDSGIALTDEGLGKLLAKLSELGLAEDTIVLLTSDHGELLGEHGDAGHVYLWEENLRIPLLLAAPGTTTPGQRVSQQVRSIDIVPTLLELVGLEPSQSIDGRSLLPLLQDESAEFPNEAWSYASVSNRGVSLRLRNQLKYIFIDSVWPPFHGAERAFDLRDDPREETDLLAGPFDQLGNLRQQMRQTLGTQHGLRVRFHNRSKEPFEVRMQGPSIRQGAIKSLDLDCACLGWTTAKEVGVEVPAETTFELRFEDVKSDQPLNFFTPQGEPVLALHLDAIEENRLMLPLAGNVWGATEVDDTPPNRGMEIWWQGSRQLGAEAPEDKNPELRKQLEALGYL